MSPKFSIIVGIYNHLKYLPMLVDALKRQTLKDFEVHFCDDGSDDGTEEFFNELSLMDADDVGFPFRYHRQKHEGMRLSRNLNQGIRQAQGQYCVFIMGDSFPELDYLELLDLWCKPERMICGIRVQLSEISGKLEGVDMDWRLKKHVIPTVDSIIIGQPWGCLTGNGLTIPTQALKEHGMWSEEFEGYGGDDNELIARMFYKGLVPWSVIDLRLYHNWHKSLKTNVDNLLKLKPLLISYGS